MDVRTSIVVMPCVMMMIMKNIPLLIPVGCNSLHRLPDIVMNQTWFKFESGKSGYPASRETCDNPASNLLDPACVGNSLLEIHSNINHSHISFCTV